MLDIIHVMEVIELVGQSQEVHLDVVGSMLLKQILRPHLTSVYDGVEVIVHTKVTSLPMVTLY
jgi:hypothetical protein